MDKYMEFAKQNAEEGIKRGEGGPFGAVIIDKKVTYYIHLVNLVQCVYQQLFGQI